MSGNRIYLGYPNERYFPSMPGWVDEARQAMSMDSEWAGWTLIAWEYDMSCSMSINDATAVIKSAVGPCVLLRNVQNRVLIELRERLQHQTMVLTGKVDGPETILTLLENARDLHIAGEPMLPRKLIIALLLFGKLERHQMWAGKNKGYMWASDLGKGRGIDKEFADQLPAVINDLYLHEILIRKKSGGKNKYALNPARRREIYEMCGTLKFPEKLHEILYRDTRVASARHLDSIRTDECY